MRHWHYFGRFASIALVAGLLGPPPFARADGDESPQGRQTAKTILASGATATTNARSDASGLRVSTDMPIAAPGVYASNVDLQSGSKASPGGRLPGATTISSVPPTVLPPTGGANEIVRGQPLSYDTRPDGGTSSFGGVAIGGWTYASVTPDSVTPGRQTTPWRAVTRVVQLDPRALALNVEHELGFPPIALKVNPDPGLAQLESWFWAQNYSGEIRARSGTSSETHTECRLNNGNLECQPVSNSITVDLRQIPTRYAWDFGDRRTAQDGHLSAFTTSDGLGHAYTDPHMPSSVQHKYVESSLKFFDAGGFPISLRITWDAAFRVNGGGWQGLDPITGTFESRHQVRESWPVGVNNATTIHAVAP